MITPLIHSSDPIKDKKPFILPSNPHKVACLENHMMKGVNDSIEKPHHFMFKVKQISTFLEIGKTKTSLSHLKPIQDMIGYLNLEIDRNDQKFGIFEKKLTVWRDYVERERAQIVEKLNIRAHEVMLKNTKKKINN